MTATARESPAPGMLVVGEALVDIVVTPDGRTEVHPGGSPANVALGLARLGWEVGLLTEIGDDAHGDVVRRHLTDAGVHLEEPVRGATTSVARARLDEHGGATYSFDLTWSLPVGHLDRPVPLHVHTGSLATVLEPGAERVETLLAGVREASTTSYDPNVRPALQGRHQDAVARVERFVRLSDVVKASAEDVEWLYPGRSRETVARTWARRGPAFVVITLGAEGALAVTAAEHLIRVAPVDVTVADTVGAGDSFMAALIDGLARADLLGVERRARLHAIPVDVLTAVLERAVRASTITVSRPGADPPTAAELATTDPHPRAAASAGPASAGGLVRSTTVHTDSRAAGDASRERNTT